MLLLFLLLLSLFTLLKASSSIFLPNETSSNLFFLNSFEDYSTTIKCNAYDFKTESEIEQELNSINLRWIDSIVFVSLGIVTFFSTSFIILTFIKYPQMREPPGDIILGISISESILTIHWILSAGRFLTYPGDPPVSSGQFCQFNAFFSMIAGAFEFLYNCCFCIFVIYKVKSVLKGVTINQKLFHIPCFIITFLIILIMELTESLGKNLFGTCSIKAVSKIPLIGPLLFLIYVILAMSTIFYFKKYVPNEERFRQYREEFLNYYYKYVKACAIIWSILAICNIVAVANCYSKNGGLAGFNIFLTIGNIAKLFTPLVLSFLRYQDPFLNTKVRRFFRKVKCWFLRKQATNTIINEKFLMEEQKVGEIKKNNPFEFPDKQMEVVIKNSPLESGSVIDDQDIWLNILKNEIKVQFTYTMLAGILLNYKNVRGALEISTNVEHQSFNTKKRYPITCETLKRYLPNVINELNEKSYNTFSANMIVYAPEAFDELIQQDQDIMDLEVSLDLEKNYEQIQKASGADGGKGGEFFFFSYDNRVIIKTLSKDDLDQLRSILKDYYRYFKKHHDSMIAKIYGIYTFERRDIKDQTTSILLMRNIAACPKKYVLRTYDLKGSTFDREVLKNKTDIELNKVTLKDIDFLKLEKKIFIEENYKIKLHDLLEKDSDFFRQKKLIDYSLIVFKIDKKKYFEDMMSEGKNPDENFFLNKRELYSLKSVQEEGVCYHIGIIDYLQPYNLQKYFEKNFKKLLKADKDLNTSSQDPKTYQERFCNFVKDIF